LSGGDDDAGDGGDAWQGLASESQGGNGVQLVMVRNLAGGVALEGNRYFVVKIASVGPPLEQRT
jgi:hypothetical protein